MHETALAVFVPSIPAPSRPQVPVNWEGVVILILLLRKWSRGRGVTQLQPLSTCVAQPEFLPRNLTPSAVLPVVPALLAGNPGPSKGCGRRRQGGRG